MIKFIFKLGLVIIIALAAVIYHNTESGKEMEKRIGEEIQVDKLTKRGQDLLDKTIYFLSLKGMEYKKKTEEAKDDLLKKSIEVKKNLLNKSEKEDGAHKQSAKSSKKKEIKKETVEKIEEKDRKKLEEILEKES